MTDYDKKQYMAKATVYVRDVIHGIVSPSVVVVMRTFTSFSFFSRSILHALPCSFSRPL